ncbi:MAG: histidinol-phosphatase HisJ family protein [Clostridia bacterium]|nr:histidinol-phosphatase HisJ family protein [Clostridia bacterium]
MYKNIVDLHVHTDNSFDGNHSATFFCEKAELLDLRAVAFTDHCEVDQFRGDSDYEKRIFQAFFEIAKVRSAFRGKLLVLNGIELGQPAYDIETANDIVKRYDYDQIIGSVHNLRGGEDFYFMENLSLPQAEKLLKEYFNAIIEMLEWGNFDVLAHLTYPLRYFYSKSNLDIDLNKFKNQIDDILLRTAESEKSLEINTAALRQPLNKLSPEVDVIKRFKELGGKYVSVGSDAHYAEHLAADIDMAYNAALEAGFDSITFFEKRTPMQMKIEMEG